MLRTFTFTLCLLSWALWSCSECERDLDCPATQVCEDGQCAAPVCRRDEECPPDRRCRANRCQLVEPAPAPEPGDALVLRPAG